jgi:low temperature requirement protein LtrA
MDSKKKSFRDWWMKPANVRDRDLDRKVSFLELFYDLVYVVIISQLAHGLAENVNLISIGRYSFMFLVIWLAWINGTLYHELHGNNDIRTRIFTFLQMFTVVGMAIFAHNALTENYLGFVISFVAYQLLLTFLWWRTGIHDKTHRPLSNPYSFAFLFSSIIFISSLFVEQQWRFYLWGSAVFITTIIPMLLPLFYQKNKDVMEQIDITGTATPALVERFGLFNIIVLGEIIISVVNGVSHQHNLTLQLGITALLGMGIAISIWWLYFDFVAHQMPKEKRNKTYLWLYLHLILTLATVSVGASVFNVVSHYNHHLDHNVKWLLLSSLSVVLFSIICLIHTIQKSGKKNHKLTSITSFVVLLLIIGLGFLELPLIYILSIIIVLLFIPIFSGYRKGKQ